MFTKKWRRSAGNGWRATSHLFFLFFRCLWYSVEDPVGLGQSDHSTRRVNQTYAVRIYSLIITQRVKDEWLLYPKTQRDLVARMCRGVMTTQPSTGNSDWYLSHSCPKSDNVDRGTLFFFFYRPKMIILEWPWVKARQDFPWKTA